MTAFSDRFFRSLLAALILLAGASAGPGVRPRRRRRARQQPGRAAVQGAGRSTCRPQLRELDYDAYRDIRFRPEKALWRAEKLPFELMFFHQGRAVPEPVRINVVEPAGERVVAFDPALFDYGKNKLDPQTLRGLGFNGFRVHYAINKPGYKDEVVVFQGASYFRALGKGQSYGLSARGLAVDTAAAEGEEFPRFVEFWIERPRANATSLTIYALLDSRRVAGAYRFVLTPGAETTMQVTARLYLREKIGKLGIAPLTSMFAFGENQPGRDDYRPEVHDSDGLSIQLGDGEWIWRPLVNPRRLLVTSFGTTNPRGFGLMQRDRSPASYEDPEAQYERRPSAWIEPVGNWGAGPRRAGADPDARTRPTTTSSRSGCRRRCRRPASRSTSPTGSTGRARARPLPARAGSCRRGAAAASSSSPTATSTSSSISTARRCARSPPEPTSSR